MAAQLNNPLPNLYLVIFQDDTDLELETEVEAFSEAEAREAVSHMLGPYASVIDVALLGDDYDLEEDEGAQGQQDEDQQDEAPQYTSELIEEDPVTVEES